MLNFIVRLVTSARECVVNLSIFPSFLHDLKWRRDEAAIQDDSENEVDELDDLQKKK